MNTQIQRSPIAHHLRNYHRSPPTHPNGGETGFFAQLVEYEQQLLGEQASPSLTLREYTLGVAGAWNGCNRGVSVLPRDPS